MAKGGDKYQALIDALGHPVRRRVLRRYPLDQPQLASAELPESGSTIAENPTSPAATCTGQLEPSLLRMVLKRGGITEDREGWRAPDGRRTTAVGDAFVWALEWIAQDADGRRRR
jgi:hypothetical protein